MRAYIEGSSGAVPLFPRMPSSSLPYTDWVSLKVKLLQEVRYMWDRHFELEIALSDTEADQLYDLVGQKLFGTRENFDEYFFKVEEQEDLVSA